MITAARIPEERRSLHNVSKILRATYKRPALDMSGGPGSAVGIATGYGLAGPGIESRWWRDFRYLSRPALGPTRPPGSFPGVKSGWGVTLTLQPLLVPWSRKSKAIPLLPLWAVRPVQSLSACTRVHFTFFFLLDMLLLAELVVRLCCAWGSANSCGGTYVVLEERMGCRLRERACCFKHPLNAFQSPT